MFIVDNIPHTSANFTWSFDDVYAYEDAKRRLQAFPGVVFDDNAATISKENTSNKEYNYLYNLCEHFECMYW